MGLLKLLTFLPQQVFLLFQFGHSPGKLFWIEGALLKCLIPPAEFSTQ